MDLAVSIILIVVLLTALLNLVLGTSKQRRVDGEVARALAVARTTIEELRVLPLADLSALDGRGFDVQGPNGEARGLTPVAGDPDNLPGRLSIRPVTGTSNTLYEVRATVTWRGPRGNQTFELRTRMSERKP